MIRDIERIEIALLLLILGALVLGFDAVLRRCAPRVLWVVPSPPGDGGEPAAIDDRQGVLDLAPEPRLYPRPRVVR